MGLIQIMERSGDNDVRRFEDALRMAKESIKEACEIFDDMKAQFSERGGSHMRGSYYRRDDWDGMEERRGRDSMGRYR